MTIKNAVAETSPAVHRSNTKRALDESPLPIYGAAQEIRTLDLSITNRMLYQLS